MNKERSGDYYYRGDELEPVLRADLFNPDGTLSELGIEEFRRLSRVLLRERGLPVDEIAGVFIQWKHDQWMEVQEPGYLKRQGPV